jgi:L-ascorbate metabolism protein UlaG (beta-lactamase superfamily)
MLHRDRSRARAAGTIAVLALMVSGCSLLWARVDLAPYASLLQHEGTGTVTARFLGTSSIVFSDGKTVVISDGFVSRPGLAEVLFGLIEPKRARIEDALARLKLTKADAIFASHSHYDHAMDAPIIATRTGAVLLGSASTANVGRGLYLPEDRIRIVHHGETHPFDRFELSFFESLHSPGEQFSGTIDRPLTPPARVSRWTTSTTWSVFVRHAAGTILVHGSTNYVPGALRGQRADVVYLGIGRLAKQSTAFVDGYWDEVVRATEARRVVLVHWDDFFRPLDDAPLKPLPFDDFARSVQRIRCRADRDGVDMVLPVVWAVTNPFENLPLSAVPSAANCP